jgi:hypothetical protein
MESLGIREDSEAWEEIADLDQTWEDWKENKRNLEEQERLEALRKLEMSKKRHSWTPSWPVSVNNAKTVGQSSRSVNPKDAGSEDLKEIDK